MRWDLERETELGGERGDPAWGAEAATCCTATAGSGSCLLPRLNPGGLSSTRDLGEVVADAESDM